MIYIKMYNHALHIFE